MRAPEPWPSRSHPGLVRPRLLDELNGLRTARLALVVAPAGAGKTTLLAQFASTWTGPVRWWQVDSAGATAEHLVDVLLDCVPGRPSGNSPAGIDTLLPALRAAPGTPDTLVVIDDSHLLARGDAWSALETVLAHAPTWLHVLCAGRRMPDLNLSRFELAQTGLVDAEQLRFRSWEVEDLLREVYREPLPPDDTAALTRRVGGWAAGLHLFHLSTRGQPLAERRRTVAALDGRSALTRAYLARTVLGELPAQLREFLVRTCVFEVLTPERCELLLGRPGTSRQHLEELERRRAFTSSPDGGRSYCYHEVLRAHLAVTLADEIGEGAAREWHARAGASLAAEGAEVEAARAYARAEDWTAVRDILDRLGIRAVDEGVEPWRDVLPDWLVAEDPWLMLAEGRHLLARGRLAAAIDHLRAAEDRFADERTRARCRAERRLAATWLPGRAAIAGHYSAALREATRQHPTLVAASTAGQPLVQAVGYLLAGNLVEARRCVAYHPAGDADVAGLGVQLLQACWSLATGAPEGRQRVGDVVTAAERARLPWLTRMARAARALDGTPRGAVEARAVVRECDREGDQWGAALALAALCLVRSVAPVSANTDLEESVELLQRCRALDAGVLEVWAQALVALATAAVGLPDADVEAQRAEGLARSAGVPGARVAALAAARRCGSTTTDPRPFAAQCGLPPAIAVRWAGAGLDDRVRVAEPAPVEVRCFGGFRLRMRDRPVNLSGVRPRTREALRLLAMYAGRPVHRETMIEALWCDLPPAAATRNLHVTLSSLRTFLEPGTPRGHSGLVVRSGDAYRLALPEGGYSDIAEFTTALTEARRARLGGGAAAAVEPLRRAVLAYGGDLLPEDGPAEWVVHEREVLRQQATDAALGLATAALAAGAVEEAVAAAERCVQIDRYCDPAWRLLADGFDLLGNPAAAARVRRDYAEVLASLHAPGPDRQPATNPGRQPPANSGRQPPATAGRRSPARVLSRGPAAPGVPAVS
ncbi:BTAD domain-containing putative transcriptional regulator [Plantactinospora sp. GCM10030261]|uniref:BTAD domain-containing putative transcriptional regulator n=1 Tax=Plantactinospora sp. GCM10030261 TaxID=3273420 RepID=UPI00360CA6E5